MIAYLIALTLVSWVPLAFMLRDPHGRMAAVVPPEQAFSAPVVTFDSRGFT